MPVLATDFAGKYKWEAWNKNQGLSKEEAQQAYVDALLEVRTDLSSSICLVNSLEPLLISLYKHMDMRRIIQSRPTDSQEARR